MDNEKWLNKAKNEILNLPIGKKFEVKDLFEGSQWKDFSKGERILFGKYFANEVREGNIANIIALERGKDNHSRYQKTGG